MARLNALLLLAALLAASSSVTASEATGDRDHRETRDQTEPAERPAAAGQLPPESVLRLILYSREDEDWRWLAGGSTQPDRFDRLKLIPLRGGAGSLTLGGELRTRVEQIDHEAWGLASRTTDTYALLRARLLADLRLGERFRVFGQLQAADVQSRDQGPRPSIDRDDLGLQQLFAELGLPGGSSLRVGRQELSFGAGRLLSVRAGPINTRQPQDGLRWMWRRGALRVDAFAMRVADVRPGVFDDSSVDGAELFGVYLTRGDPYRSPRGAEAYLFRFDRDFAAYFAGAGAERRTTVGARGWLRGDGWEHDAELILQIGTFDDLAHGSRDIEAWAVATQSTVTLAGAWRPTLELATGFNSGDGDPSDDTLETFLAPLPRGGYFGQFAPFGPGNLQGARLAFSVQPRDKLTLTAGVYGFWRHDLADGLYGVSGFPLLAPRPGVDVDHFLGLQPELSLTTRAGRHLELELAFAVFDTADGLRALGASDDIVSAAATLRAVF